MPAFAEQPGIRAPQTGAYTALAVSPDGRTLAVADDPGAVAPRWVRLFDLAGGSERSSFRADHPLDRLGFTPDGKAVGIYAPAHLSWWDVVTGRQAKPDPARFAIQPAGLGGERTHYAVSLDGSALARGDVDYSKLVGQGLGEPKNKHGAFVRVTDNATAKTWTWHVAEADGTTDRPAVAFSPTARNWRARSSSRAARRW